MRHAETAAQDIITQQPHKTDDKAALLKPHKNVTSKQYKESSNPTALTSTYKGVPITVSRSRCASKTE